jgi:hypothetical protein
MKTQAAVSIACCLGLAVAGVAAQQKAAPMTAADCKTYADAVAKDPTKKDKDKDAQCKALADKGKAPAAPAPAKK